jgi:hypothetical protein
MRRNLAPVSTGASGDAEAVGSGVGDGGDGASRGGALDIDPPSGVVDVHAVITATSTVAAARARDQP